VVTAERWRALLIVVGFFSLGALGGAAAGGAWVKQELAASMFSGEPKAHERIFLTALSAELELSDEQRRRVEAIAARYRERRHQLLQEVFSGCGKPLEALQQEMDTALAAELDESQAQRFRQLSEARRRRFRGTDDKPEPPR
jgi:hypothetical protein